MVKDATSPWYGVCPVQIVGHLLTYQSDVVLRPTNRISKRDLRRPKMTRQIAALSSASTSESTPMDCFELVDEFNQLAAAEIVRVHSRSEPGVVAAILQLAADRIEDRTSLRCWATT